MPTHTVPQLPGLRSHRQIALQGRLIGENAGRDLPEAGQPQDHHDQDEGAQGGDGGGARDAGFGVHVRSGNR